MVVRKPITKKLKFEVLKRDNFTCQYCGKTAPEVILEIDHINPIKKNGDNNILNLITSCFDCNRGKGARELTDNQVIQKEIEQLKEINEKREQLKLLLKWKKELEKFDNEQTEIINNMIIVVSDREFSDYGKNNMIKVIKKYGMSEVMEATRLSINQYFKGNNENIAKVIEYIPRICSMRLKQKDDPMIAKKIYIKAIMRNRFGIYNEKRVAIALNEILKDVPGEEDEIIDIAKNAKNWTQFWEILNDYFDTTY